MAPRLVAVVVLDEQPERERMAVNIIETMIEEMAQHRLCIETGERGFEVQTRIDQV